MSVLPTNDKERKNLPIFKMICGYFPKALREVTRVCVANNVRYNSDRKPNDINWARGKSTQQMDSLFRHILEHEVDGLVFEELPPEVQAACGPGFERVYVLAEAAWRALAALELEIEAREGMRDAVNAGIAIRKGECVSERDGASVMAPVIGCGCYVCEAKRMEVPWCSSNGKPAPVYLCACGGCIAAREQAATRV
jgi:hypothetical protein